MRSTELDVRNRLTGLLNAMHGGALPTTFRRIRFDRMGRGGRARGVIRGSRGRDAAAARLRAAPTRTGLGGAGEMPPEPVGFPGRQAEVG